MTKDILPHNDLAQNEAIIQKGLNTFYEVGNALTEIRDNKQYKDNYSTFEDYCIERWDIKKRQAYRLIDAFEVSKNIENSVQLDTKVDLPSTESQAREIAKAPGKDQAEVWETAKEETGKEQPTAKEIKQVVETGHVHVAQNSGNNEWYTPAEYIESAHAVMGGIDLDPASSEIANKCVNADKFYTIEDSGLDNKWSGRVWLNPPYAQPYIRLFSDKLCESVLSHDIEEAIVLVNNATETTWFQNMLRMSSAVCFIDKRIKFLDPEGNEGAPLQGQAILYFGDNVGEDGTGGFVDMFGFYGVVVKSV